MQMAGIPPKDLLTMTEELTTQEGFVIACTALARPEPFCFRPEGEMRFMGKSDTDQLGELGQLGQAEIFRTREAAEKVQQGLSLCLPGSRVEIMRVEALFAQQVRVSRWFVAHPSHPPKCDVPHDYVPWLRALLLEAKSDGFNRGFEIGLADGKSNSGRAEPSPEAPDLNSGAGSSAPGEPPSWGAGARRVADEMAAAYGFKRVGDFYYLADVPAAAPTGKP